MQSTRRQLLLMLLCVAASGFQFQPLPVHHLGRSKAARAFQLQPVHHLKVVHPPRTFRPEATSSTHPDTQDPLRDSPISRMRRRKVEILSQKKRLKVALLFGLWYTLSVAYNLFSKRVLNLAPELAWTTAWLQITLGLLYVGPIWASGLRTPPQLNQDDIRRILPVALLHSLVHIGGVVSMGAGAVSFTYVVKASEPAFSAALSAITSRSFLPVPVYLTLLPVMVGVALSSVSELSFTWKSFLYAMMSNVASASRGIVGKKTMGKRLGKNLDAANLYAVLSIMSSLLLFPVTLLIEGRLWGPVFRDVMATGNASMYVGQLILAAFCYYTYNEVAFLCLEEVSPVSHAIGNTLKRVAIILSSILVFRNKLTAQGVIGSTMAVGGVLLYSLAKAKYEDTSKRH